MRFAFTSFFDYPRRLNAIVRESNHGGVQEYYASLSSILGNLPFLETLAVNDVSFSRVKKKMKF